MKAKLVYWHKARIKDHYILEMEIHQVGKSKRYTHGIKYGLTLVDLHSGKRVLMDNHHPKGPHIHLDNHEMPYKFENEERLIQDFKEIVLTHMEIKI